MQNTVTDVMINNLKEATYGRRAELPVTYYFQTGRTMQVRAHQQRLHLEYG